MQKRRSSWSQCTVRVGIFHFSSLNQQKATSNGDFLRRFSNLHHHSIRSGPLVALALVFLDFFYAFELIDSRSYIQTQENCWRYLVPIAGPSKMLLKIQLQAMFLGQNSPTFSLIALKISAAMSSTKTMSDFSRFGFSLCVTLSLSLLHLWVQLIIFVSYIRLIRSLVCVMLLMKYLLKVSIAYLFRCPSLSFSNHAHFRLLRVCLSS